MGCQICVIFSTPTDLLHGPFRSRSEKGKLQVWKIRVGRSKYVVSSNKSAVFLLMLDPVFGGFHLMLLKLFRDKVQYLQTTNNSGMNSVSSEA